MNLSGVFIKYLYSIGNFLLFFMRYYNLVKTFLSSSKKICFVLFCFLLLKMGQILYIYIYIYIFGSSNHGPLTKPSLLERNWKLIPILADINQSEYKLWNLEAFRFR